MYMKSKEITCVLSDLLHISVKVNIKDILDILDINRSNFDQVFSILHESLKSIKIEGDYLMYQHDEIKDLISILNNNFKKWAK